MADAALTLLDFAQALLGVSLALMLVAGVGVSFQALRMLEGSPRVSRSQPMPTPKSAGHRARPSDGGR